MKIPLTEVNGAENLPTSCNDHLQTCCLILDNEKLLEIIKEKKKELFDEPLEMDRFLNSDSLLANGICKEIQRIVRIEK